MHQLGLLKNVQQFHLCSYKLCDGEFAKLPQLDELHYHNVYENRSLANPAEGNKVN